MRAASAGIMGLSVEASVFASAEGGVLVCRPAGPPTMHSSSRIGAHLISVLLDFASLSGSNIPMGTSLIIILTSRSYLSEV